MPQNRKTKVIDLRMGNYKILCLKIRNSSEKHIVHNAVVRRDKSQQQYLYAHTSSFIQSNHSFGEGTEVLSFETSTGI